MNPRNSLGYDDDRYIGSYWPDAPVKVRNGFRQKPSGKHSFQQRGYSLPKKKK